MYQEEIQVGAPATALPRSSCLGVVLPLLSRGRSLVPILMCGELSGELWDYLLGPLPVDHCSGRRRGGGASGLSLEPLKHSPT